MRYGLPLPKSSRRLTVPHFRSLAEAFAACIAVETDNVKQYERLHAHSCQADILAELINLKRASRDGHLPSLHACARELRLV